MEEQDLKEELKPVEVKTGWWRQKTKKEKVLFVFFILFVAIVITGGLGIVYIRQIFGDEIGDAVLGEGVQNGWHLLYVFSVKNAKTFLLSLVIIFVTIIFFVVSKTIVKLVTKKNQRTKTIGSLIVSFLRYVAIIVDVGVILTLWGANLASAIAGVSILAIIIGFGCKNLVADVVSGMFIVFDDYFAVGDAVIIDGFRGYVTEIGLRTIKIDDRLGNIKCIANSNITTCVNLSRTLNVVIVNMEIGYNEDIERVEAIISRELPSIKDRCPKMVEAPIYRGVEAFTNSGVQISFAVKCYYQDRWDTNRDLRRELYRLFVKNDIYFTFQQIVINQADPKDRPKATPAQIKATEEMLEKSRALPVKEKEKNIFQKAFEPIEKKKAVKKTAKKNKK